MKHLLHHGVLRLKALLFVLVALIGLKAQAVETVTLQLGHTYALSPTDTLTALFVAQADGLLQIYDTDGNSVISPDLNEKGLADPLTQVGSFSNVKFYDPDGNYYRRMREIQVKAGDKYYVSQYRHHNSVTYFYAHLQGEGVAQLEIEEMNRKENEEFDITDTRYGQLSVTFNMPMVLADSASIFTPGYPNESQKRAGYGRLETRYNANTNRTAIWMLKDTINSWLNQGFVHPGEILTFTVKNVRSKTDETMLYGSDGTITLHFLVPGSPHKLVSQYLPNPFYSYYDKGDKNGIVALTFDADVMPVAQGQTAKGSLRMGYAETDDMYAEEFDAQTPGQNIVRVEGNQLLLDFTGKLRTIEAMGLTANYGTFTLRLQNVLMADGTNAYTDSKGGSGSYTFTLNYRQLFSNIAVAYVPEDGEEIEDNEIVAYFSQKNDVDFTAVQLDYQNRTNDAAAQTVIAKADIQAVEAGENGIRYIIPISDEIKNAKNVRLSYVDLKAKDGQEHPELNARFNPGPELFSTLAPTASDPEDGSYVPAPGQLTLTFGEDIVLDENLPVAVTDETAGRTVPATCQAEGKTLTVVFGETLVNTHTYSVALADRFVGNKEFAETAGRYGNYMPATTYHFTAYESQAGLDFRPLPLDGSVLTEIASVELHSNQELPLGFTGRNDRKVWIEDAEGHILQYAASVSSHEGEEGVFVLFDPAFKGEGQYNVVISDSIYLYGEGLSAFDPNEVACKIPYTLVAPVEKTFGVTVSPADSSFVKELGEVVLTAEEPMFVTEQTLSICNTKTAEKVECTLVKDAEADNRALVRFAQTLTADGTSWTLEIPAAAFGDKTWAESEGRTGKCNDVITLTYHISATVGMDRVAGDAKAQDVYNLNGVRVGTASGSVQALPKGVYIIGGKKVAK